MVSRISWMRSMGRAAIAAAEAAMSRIRWMRASALWVDSGLSALIRGANSPW